jgi:hypothetical protein
MRAGGMGMGMSLQQSKTIILVQRFESKNPLQKKLTTVDHGPLVAFSTLSSLWRSPFHAESINIRRQGFRLLYGKGDVGGTRVPTCETRAG